MTHRHATDVVSLVFGIFFAGCAATWLMYVVGLIGWAGVGLALPIVMIVTGAIGVLASVASRTASQD
ncbi:MAG TPA: hypothetical protein VFI30_08390 [Nocardioidaceae bacterium]|nr:hypothetical protein [Nocardioidaceae bacterium]